MVPALVAPARAVPDLARVAEAGAQAHPVPREEQGLEPALALARELAQKLARELARELAAELAGAPAAYRRVSMRRVRARPLRLANPLATRSVPAADPGSFTTCAKIRASYAISPGSSQ
jgi:hypothetical protein